MVILQKNYTNPKQEKKPSGHKLNVASEEPPNLVIATLLNSSNEKKWYLDSGASHHITPNRNWLVQYTRIVGPNKIYLGDNTYCDVIGK